MNTRERILTIRLLEKAAKHPMYARALGLEGVPAEAHAGEAVRPEITECCRASSTTTGI